MHLPLPVALQLYWGGGKFRSGAITGSFSYLFAEGVRGLQKNNPASNGLIGGALDVIGKIWALPNTIIGAVYGGIGHVAGWMMGTNPYITFGNNAIQFENNPFAAAGAITLGNTITYGGSRFDLGHDGNPFYLHERPHTIQSQILGPLYLPAHAIFGSGARIFNGSWHGSFNVLETGPQKHPPQPWP